MRHARGGVDGVWFPVAEVGQHARQDGRNHVTVDGARSIVRGELTPRGHAGTRGQPVRRAFAGIRYASQKIHKAMTTMNATANTGSVNSVHASTSPWTARNKTIDRINANTHTIAPTRATRWLSSSERRQQVRQVRPAGDLHLLFCETIGSRF